MDPERRLLKIGIVFFMFATGCGPGEAMAVNVDDFNWRTNEVLVKAIENGAGKTRFRKRWVHLPDKAVALIGEIPSSGRAFLKPTGEAYKLRTNGGGQMARSFRKLCSAADLGPDVVCYTARHTWATYFSCQVGDHDLLLDRGRVGQIRNRPALPEETASRSRLASRRTWLGL